MNKFILVALLLSALQVNHSMHSMFGTLRRVGVKVTNFKPRHSLHKNSTRKMSYEPEEDKRIKKIFGVGGAFVFGIGTYAGISIWDAANDKWNGDSFEKTINSGIASYAGAALLGGIPGLWAYQAVLLAGAAACVAGAAAKNTYNHYRQK